MKLIDVNQLSMNFGIENLFTDATFQIKSGNRYGLIGANGTGKTTLLNLLTKTEKPAGGSIVHSGGLKIGYVNQYINFSDELTVNDALMVEYKPIINELIEAEQHLATVAKEDQSKAFKLYEKVRDKYDELECDSLELKIETILDSMNLGSKKMQKIESLSGGEKSVLNLVAALLKTPDLLILDEPGNHLDYLGLAWLEEFLLKFKGTIIVVSHNRYLLDRMCTHILEIDQKKINVFTGSYSEKKKKKLNRSLSNQANYKVAMRKIERLEILVKKLQLVISPKTEARKTQLERERKKAGSKPKLDNDRIEVNLNTDTKKANIALSVNDFSFAYENNILFDNASTDIFCGEKVALVGLNGTGKTTLIQKILEKGNWENPILRVGPSLTIGYLSQKQDTLNPENSIEEEIRDMGQISKSQAFQMASPFLFKYQDMQKKVATLSGGEKNRLQLIKLKYMNANFLILDEPTNHLDIPSREAIEEALLEYNGTLLIVSHDRYLLDSIVDRVIEIKDRKLISHIGNFSEFWVNNVRLNMKMSGKVSNRKSQREKSKDKKQSIKKTVSFFGVSEIENKINELENEKIQLEKEVMMFFQSNDHVKGRKTNDKLSKVVHQLNKAYEKWEKLV